MKDFEGHDPIRMKIILDEEPRDSMVIATPFEKEKAFYYNQKIIGMRAKGVVEFRGQRHYFEPEDSFGSSGLGTGRLDVQKYLVLECHARSDRRKGIWL